LADIILIMLALTSGEDSASEVEDGLQIANTLTLKAKMLGFD